MGVSNSDSGGRTYGKKGQTPVIKAPGTKYKCNLLSLIQSQGKLHFMLLEEDVKATTFTSFLERLLSLKEKKLYLILDKHPAHIAKPVQQWVAAHKDRMRLIYLPAYSPELNPVELLNQDVKSNAVKKKDIDGFTI